ncbi:hypothetical protein FQN57_004595 [Myotisia sp. PD_48]|nr:hypothetical protein FQN57_004595 [Myotisia sp. PD_48]
MLSHLRLRAAAQFSLEGSLSLSYPARLRHLPIFTPHQPPYESRLSTSARAAWIHSPIYAGIEKTYAEIHDQITGPCGPLKENTSWGFVIYRTCYKDDKAWQKMVQEIQETVQGETEGILDLLPRHDLVLMDDKAQFDGATSHEVRDHFSSWVVDQLTVELINPDELDRQAILENKKNEGRDTLYLGPRYDYCLFADDICLDSFEYMAFPVIKMLERSWGHLPLNERDYTIHPDWEDGPTDEAEEDVGWLYMDITDYVQNYSMLVDNSTWWDDLYDRAPRAVRYREAVPNRSWIKYPHVSKRIYTAPKSLERTIRMKMEQRKLEEGGAEEPKWAGWTD